MSIADGMGYLAGIRTTELVAYAWKAGRVVPGVYTHTSGGVLTYTCQPRLWWLHAMS